MRLKTGRIYDHKKNEQINNKPGCTTDTKDKNITVFKMKNKR
jgi:hypothetical protein